MGKGKGRWRVLWTSTACAALFFGAAASTSSQTDTKSSLQVADISGVWVQDVQPALNPGWTDSQGKKFDNLPLTPWGEEQFKASRATHGANMVPSMTSTEPIAKCSPARCSRDLLLYFPDGDHADSRPRGHVF